MFLDGTIDAGTAWLSRPDRSGESARPGWDPEEFADRLAYFHAAGIPTATHAIGDAAVGNVLDCVAALPVSAGSPRHRIEHLETIPDDTIGRLESLGVIASMQPSHATEYTLADGSDNWSRRLGADRAAQGWRCGDLVRAGATVVLGSDWPVAPYDARLTLSAAVLRCRSGDRRLDPVQPDQALTIEQALLATGSTHSLVTGRLSGAVRVGYDADLTVFAEDPREVPGHDLVSLPVTANIVDGQVFHRSG